MSEEKISQIDDKCCLDDGKTNVRRYSTGALDKRGGLSKAQVQTRYRGNQLSSTHDLCKHGKRRDEELVIKPWKLVKKKDVSKPLQVVKKDVVSEIVKSFDVKRSEVKSTSSAVVRTVKKIDLDVKKVSKISENKSSKEDVLKNLKNKEKMKTDLDVNKVSRISENKSSKEDVMKNVKNKEKMKTDLDVNKVSRISENKSSKEDVVKNVKNKEKMKNDEYVLEKTLYVVESSIEKEKEKSIKNEIQQFSEKKILRSSGKKSLSLSPSVPKPIRQTTLSEKKENCSANLVANSKPKIESKIMPKRIGLRATPPSTPTSMQVSFKKGKILEQKPADSTPTLIKFKKRIVQEPKLISDEIKKKKNVKVEEEEDVGDLNDEDKQEKVVLRHREVEEKKKLQRLYNNVIEETVNKLEEVKKSKVKALVGAFETVISLQENDRASHKKKIQRKST